MEEILTGGDGSRKLRPHEHQDLKNQLDKFSEEATKISTQEIEFKKGLVKWLIGLYKKELGGHMFKSFNTGSAYERVQAGEAKDFDVMIFLNVRKWSWEVHEDKEKPGYCWITRGKHRPKDKENSFSHLLDNEGRLSSLKVRKLFIRKMDKFLRKHNPLEYRPKTQPAPSAEKAESGDTEKEEDKKDEEKAAYKVEVTRKHQGPSITLLINCNGMEFTLDLVNSLHSDHVRMEERCDFVAKPYDKTEIFSLEHEHLWRKSYSRKESKRLRDIDIGNKVHRKLLKIFKILRMNQAQLKLLKTYVFKNLLLHMSELKGREWQEEDISNRFVDMVIALRNCLADQKLPVFFNKDVNLLSGKEGYTEENLGHIRAYLRRIANKGIEGYTSLLTLKPLPEPEPSKKKKRRASKNTQLKTTPDGKKTRSSGDKRMTEKNTRSIGDKRLAQKKSNAARQRTRAVSGAAKPAGAAIAAAQTAGANRKSRRAVSAKSTSAERTKKARDAVKKSKRDVQQQQQPGSPPVAGVSGAMLINGKALGLPTASGVRRARSGNSTAFGTHYDLDEQIKDALDTLAEDEERKWESLMDTFNDALEDLEYSGYEDHLDTLYFGDKEDIGYEDHLDTLYFEDKEDIGYEDHLDTLYFGDKEDMFF